MVNTLRSSKQALDSTRWEKKWYTWSSFSKLLLQVRSAVYGALLSQLNFAIFKQQQDLEEAMLQCKTPNSLANMSLPHLMDLDEMLKEQDSQNLIFFLETSDKSQVTVRQSCALESAAKFSGRVVVLLVTSPVCHFTAISSTQCILVIIDILLNLEFPKPVQHSLFYYWKHHF